MKSIVLFMLIGWSCAQSIDVPFIIKQPVDQFVVLGDSAQFEVMAGGFNLTYQWQRGSVLLNDSVEDVSGSTTPMLGLANVTMGDLGEYSCVVRNLFNSVTTNGAQLQELGAPVFVQEPLDLGVLNGNDVTINCAATSLDGTVNITWEALDTQGMALVLPPPTVTDMGGNVTQSTITLRNVTADQAGIYTCTAANRVTNISTEFNLSVITPAIVGVEDVLTSAGNDVVLFCSASGDQRLTYMWGLISNEIAGASIPFSNLTLPRLFGANTSNLTIRNISLADTFNNAASVRCVVSLFGMEIGSAPGNLTIQRVVITQPPLYATFTVPNDTLTLNCTAMNPPGAPLPLQFYWVRDTKVLEEDARTVVWSSPEDNSTSATSVLTITNITRQDRGLYLCIVTNRGSEDRIESDFATVSLLFAPVVTSISLDDGNDVFVAMVNGSFPVPVDRNDIVAIAVFEAEPIPFLFELTRINDSDRILVNNSNFCGPQLFFSANLPVLSLADSGVTFEFAAVNTLGRGSQTFTVLVQDVPGPINHSMLTNEVVSLLSVNLSWPLPPDNNAPITSYNLSYCETGRDAPTGCINFQSLKFATNMTTTSNGVVSYMWSSGLEFNSGFAVNVTAENALGMGEALNGPAHVLTATPDDAKPVGVQISVLTDTFSIIDWSLPTVAQAEGVVVQQFNVTYDAIGSGNQNIGNVVSNLSTPFSDREDGGAFIFGRNYNVSIVAIYTTPSAVSDPTFFNFTVPTIDNVTPIFDEMPMTVGTLGPVTLTVNWPLPSPNRFLTRYDLDVTISSLLPNSRRRRKRRQTSSTTIAIDDLNTRSANVPVQPFSSVTVQVFAVYKPDMSRAPLTQLISVQTLQDRPTEPMIMMFTQKGLFMLLLEWMPPLEPNGVIQEYQVTYSEEGQPGLSIKVMEPGVTKYIITNLNANTLYVATVLAVTLAGAGPSSGESRARTDFGVTTPLTVNVLAGITKCRYYVSIVLRGNFGPIKRFQIIVSNTKLENTVRFGDIQPYRSTSGLYVIRAIDHSAGSFTVEIGTGFPFTNQGVIYPDKVFERNTEYYIFVRAFSDVVKDGEATRYNDSVLFGPIFLAADTVSLEVPGEVSEDVGVVTVCARISPVAMRDVSVTIATSDYSAFAPGDYTAVTSNLVILANESLICVNLTIVNDNVVENDEAFNVSLTSMDTDVMVVNGSAQVRILSDPADVPALAVVVFLRGLPINSNFFTGLQLNLTCIINISSMELDIPTSLSVSAEWSKSGTSLTTSNRVTVDEELLEVEPLQYQTSLLFNSLDKTRDEGNYTCAVHVIHNLVGVLDSAASLYITVQTLFFQLKLTGVSNCESWRSMDIVSKDMDIVKAIVKSIVAMCDCDFTADRLTDRVFLCLPSSPQSITYQAQLHGTLQTPVADLGIKIQEWALSGVTIPVQLVPLKLEGTCVSSTASTLECDPTESTQMEDKNKVQFGTIIAAVMSVVVVFVMIIIAVAIIITVRIRHSKMKPETEPERLGAIPLSYVTGNNTQYEDIKKYQPQDPPPTDVKNASCPAYMPTVQPPTDADEL